MLALALVLFTVLQAVAALGGIQQSIARPTFWPPIPRMPRSRELVHAVAPVATCADIEELPAGLVEGYKQHKAVGYHDFTAEEVSRQSGQAARTLWLTEICSLSGLQQESPEFKFQP